MSDITVEGCDVSFSPLYREPTKQYTPKIFYDKKPIRVNPNQKPGTIDYKTQKVKEIKSPNETYIKAENPHDIWKPRIMNNYNTNPYPTLESIHKYYGEPDLNTQIPLFVPSDKIYLNTKSGIEEQWAIYLKKTGQL